MRNALAYATLLCAAAALALTACDDKPTDSTAGQQLDQAIASAKQSAGEVKADASAAAEQTRTAASEAAAAVANEARDMAITTKVNAELAKDKQLSALSINVDTNAGRVELQGSAPSDSARERATSIAASVDGVRAVDNRLTVERKS